MLRYTRVAEQTKQHIQYPDIAIALILKCICASPNEGLYFSRIETRVNDFAAMAVPPLNIPDSTLTATLPSIQSARSIKLEVAKNWLSDWRQARKCISDAHAVRRHQLLDNSKILHQDIAEQAQALSSRNFEQSKKTLEEWKNLQDVIKKVAYPSPPTSSRLLRANDQTLLNAILSPRYRRQVAYHLSDDSAARDRFSLSKAVTSGAIGCHVNAAITGGKCTAVRAAPDSASLNNGHFFLTEPDVLVGLPVVESKHSLHSPPKTMSFREPSLMQMEAFRSLSRSLSQKMKSLIELTGMLALHVLDDHKRRQLRKELESTKEVCQELKKKLENIGVIRPQVKSDHSALAAEHEDLLRRIENLHPLQMLLARTVTSLDSEDEAILKRTQRELQSCVASVNSMSHKNIKQLAAANEIAVRDRRKRQRLWLEYTYVIVSMYRLMAMRPLVDSKAKARNAASSVIAKFLRQKTLSKTLTRQAKAIRVLTRAMLHYTKWVLRMRRKKDSTKIIKQFLVECRDVHPAAKTIKKFRKRVISIQKMARHFLMRRNFLYMRLLSRWVKSEEKQRKQYNGKNFLYQPVLFAVYILN